MAYIRFRNCVMKNNSSRQTITRQKIIVTFTEAYMRHHLFAYGTFLLDANHLEKYNVHGPRCFLQDNLGTCIFVREAMEKTAHGYVILRGSSWLLTYRKQRKRSVSVRHA